jgi:hypothetical protein
VTRSTLISLLAIPAILIAVHQSSGKTNLALSPTSSIEFGSWMVKSDTIRISVYVNNREPAPLPFGFLVVEETRHDGFEQWHVLWGQGQNEYSRDTAVIDTIGVGTKILLTLATDEDNLWGWIHYIRMEKDRISIQTIELPLLLQDDADESGGKLYHEKADGSIVFNGMTYEEGGTTSSGQMFPGRARLGLTYSVSGDSLVLSPVK